MNDCKKINVYRIYPKLKMSSTFELLETLDHAKVNSFHRRLVILASLGPFSDAFNEFGVSASLVAVGILFQLSPVLLLVIIASYWVGVAAGGFLGGMLSDLLRSNGYYMSFINYIRLLNYLA